MPGRAMAQRRLRAKRTVGRSRSRPRFPGVPFWRWRRHRRLRRRRCAGAAARDGPEVSLTGAQPAAPVPCSRYRAQPWTRGRGMAAWDRKNFGEGVGIGARPIVLRAVHREGGPCPDVDGFIVAVQKDKIEAYKALPGPRARSGRTTARSPIGVHRRRRALAASSPPSARRAGQRG